MKYLWQKYEKMDLRSVIFQVFIPNEHFFNIISTKTRVFLNLSPLIGYKTQNTSPKRPSRQKQPGERASPDSYIFLTNISNNIVPLPRTPSNLESSHLFHPPFRGTHIVFIVNLSFCHIVIFIILISSYLPTCILHFLPTAHCQLPTHIFYRLSSFIRSPRSPNTSSYPKNPHTS